MSAPPPAPPSRFVLALIGLLVGGAAGFLFTETVGGFCAFVLGRALHVAGGGALLVAFVAVPLGCAVLGAVIGVRRAGRASRPYR
ncbi:hypothetical protein GCM10010329_33540 [Streptomyces spiroverticillatus]|uniref:Uncharacterized protein n=1 Tax=Streptomyces finlayi TaxID=67296 RepID=A0A918WWR2_9ACTN|nr:hypothetical protein [Streptomyces finlayi]GHA08085.1 hypothetical protein GCM10010329_33540 [Streptomyces spiroverticillatus]GHC91165.1 hypothetical protein GCM10010334_25950 [Streptomyces finlayi]